MPESWQCSGMNTNQQSPNQNDDDKRLQAVYRAMSADKNREAETAEWCEVLSSEPVEGGR
jgi:hypothetical protein